MLGEPALSGELGDGSDGVERWCRRGFLVGGERGGLRLLLASRELILKTQNWG